MQRGKLGKVGKGVFYMVYVIGSIGTIQRSSKLKSITLSCMEKNLKTVQKEIYDPECIQKRINKASEVRAKIEAENAKRNEEIKKINFLG